jgi:hypothetical protein
MPHKYRAGIENQILNRSGLQIEPANSMPLSPVSQSILSFIVLSTHYKLKAAEWLSTITSNMLKIGFTCSKKCNRLFSIS